MIHFPRIDEEPPSMADKILDESSDDRRPMQTHGQEQETDRPTAPTLHHSASAPSVAPSAKEEIDNDHTSCCHDDTYDDDVDDSSLRMQDQQGVDVSTLISS